jgi:hypothetical protein
LGWDKFPLFFLNLCITFRNEIAGIWYYYLRGNCFLATWEELQLRKTVKMMSVAVLFGAGLWIGSMVTSSNADSIVDPNQPGSVHDPIVTKSYVDEAVRTLVATELAKQGQSDIEAKINQLASQVYAELNEAKKNMSTDLIVVTVNKGQTLYAGAGTEFIIRTGQPIAVSNSANGIPDVTSGEDIANGKPVGLNHLLIFPREGRGVKPSTDAALIVMVRGQYLLVNEDGTVAAP